MLTDLHVRDLGVIEDLTLVFGPGMTALTGETGAGKTLVVEALQLVLGGRANPGMVRAGATEALVEARFVMGEGDDAREVILTRSVPAEGRSRAWVDGRMAPLGALGEAAAELVEIHGQHEHRALVTPGAQRNVLDAFAGTDLSRVRAIRSQLHALDEALAGLGGDAQQRAREADVLRYQVEEIAAAHLEDPDEEAALRRGGGPPGRRRRLPRRRARGGGADRPRRRRRAPWTCSVAPAAALAGREAFDELPRPPGRRRRGAVRPGPLAARRGRGAGRTTRSASIDVQERRRLLAELRRKYGEDLAAVMAYGREGAARLAALEDAEGEAARLQAEREQPPAELADAEAAVRTVRARGRRHLRRPWSASGWGPGHGGRPARGAGGARGDGRAGGARAGRQRGRGGAAAGPRRLGWRAGPGHAGHPPGRVWAAPRRWSSTRWTPAWAAPPPWPWATRSTRWAATARCSSSPTWPRWRRRPTRRSASSRARPGGAP